MDMGSGPSLEWMQKVFWAFIGAAVGAMAAANLYIAVLGTQRRMTAKTATPDSDPSAPKNVVTTYAAALTAVTREISETLPSAQWTKHFPYGFPPLGRILLVLAELSIVLALCFYKLNPEDKWQWEDVAYRCGCIGLAQLPLVFLLAGKNNIVGLVIGSSYERLNWIHRWAARVLFLTVTLHLGFWLRDWGRYHYIATKIGHSQMAQQGLTAWAILLWINVSSLLPIRKWNYEVFVIQHTASYAAFTAMVYIHVDGGYKNWVWVSIGLLLADRSLRLLRFIYINLAICHRSRGARGLWSCRATFEPLAQGMTRIRIRNPPISWTPGQHVFLSCHSIAPFQAHPFTISSIPMDGEMTFVVKSQQGGTKRFSKFAQKQQILPIANGDHQKTHCAVAIEGPYGRMRNLRQFDSVVLMAGATGATFTMPLIRDIVASWRCERNSQKPSWFSEYLVTVTRYIRFVWVIKSKAHFEWFSPDLNKVLDDVQKLKHLGNEIHIDISIYVTCDEDFVNEAGSCRKRNLEKGGGTAEREKERLVTDIGNLKSEKGTVTVEAVDSWMPPSARSAQNPTAACGTDGTCCCKTVIKDEDEISVGDRGSCNCKSTTSSSVYVEPQNSDLEMKKETSMSTDTESVLPFIAAPLSHPDIAVFAGRPHVRSVINKVLEQSRGESAVVVCGPMGLVTDVRRSTVSLSDERAVHRGTGAQGIYLHTEAFGY